MVQLHFIISQGQFSCERMSKSAIHAFLLMCHLAAGSMLNLMGAISSRAGNCCGVSPPPRGALSPGCGYPGSRLGAEPGPPWAREEATKRGPTKRGRVPQVLWHCSHCTTAFPGDSSQPSTNSSQQRLGQNSKNDKAKSHCWSTRVYCQSTSP